MFVQTHLGRSRYQAGVSLPNHQASINVKPKKSLSLGRPDKRGAQCTSKTCRDSEIRPFDIQLRSENRCSNAKIKSECCVQLDAEALVGPKQLNKYFEKPNEEISAPSRDNPRYSIREVTSECASCTRSISLEDLLSDILVNLNPNLGGKMLPSNISAFSNLPAMTSSCSKQPRDQHKSPGTMNSKIYQSIFDNLFERLASVGRLLTGGILFGKEERASSLRDDLLTVTKLMKECFNLMVKFSFHLITYQLDTVRLLINDADLNTERSSYKIEGDETLQNMSNSGHFIDHYHSTPRCSVFDENLNSTVGDLSSIQVIRSTCNKDSRSIELIELLRDQINSAESMTVTTLPNVACNSLTKEIDLGSSLRSCHSSFQNQTQTVNQPRVQESNVIWPYDVKQINFLTNEHCNPNDVESNLPIDLQSPDIPVAHSSDGTTKAPRKLSLTGARGRNWFVESKGNCINIRRSEEIFPESINTTSSLDNGILSPYELNSSSQSGSLSENKLDVGLNFVEGLGIGQVVSRHALVSAAVGEIQLYLTDARGILEMAVIQARGLRITDLSSTYAKVYLMRNKKCIAKYKTRSAIRTTDPVYHQKFIYRQGHEHCMIQAIIWARTRRKSKKILLGAAQIQLDALDISKSVISWYRLFDVPSMAGPIYSSKFLRQRLLSISAERSSV